MSTAATRLLEREERLRASGAIARHARWRDAADARSRRHARGAGGGAVEARRATGAAERLGPGGPEAFGALLARLPEAGEVMTLVRNDTCVHELTGRAAPPDIDGAIGQFVGEIDLQAVPAALALSATGSTRTPARGRGGACSSSTRPARRS